MFTKENMIAQYIMICITLSLNELDTAKNAFKVTFSFNLKVQEMRNTTCIFIRTN